MPDSYGYAGSSPGYSRQPTAQTRHRLPRIDVKDVDVGLVQCMQYMWNYGFYRFGLEICFVTMVINMCTRLDVFAVVYGILLLIMFMLSRQALARIWASTWSFWGYYCPYSTCWSLGYLEGSASVSQESYLLPVDKTWYSLRFFTLQLTLGIKTWPRKSSQQNWFNGCTYRMRSFHQRLSSWSVEQAQIAISWKSLIL